MPRFIPDVSNYSLGRSSLMWFTPTHNAALILARTAEGQWEVLEVPTAEERGQYEYIFDSGRENHVTYAQVRDWDLADMGRVVYVDDYDDIYTDVYISKLNDPYSRATAPEPIWSEE